MAAHDKTRQRSDTLTGNLGEPEMLDTIQATDSILQEKPATAQELLFKIERLVRSHALATINGNHIWARELTQEMIGMVRYAGLQTQWQQTWPHDLSVSRKQDAFDHVEFVVELEDGSPRGSDAVGFTGMLYDDNTEPHLLWFGIVRREEIEKPFNTTAKESEALKTFIELIGEEGVLTLKD